MPSRKYLALKAQSLLGQEGRKDGQKAGHAQGATSARGRCHFACNAKTVGSFVLTETHMPLLVDGQLTGAIQIGIMEGRDLGMDKGRELGHELGFYAGCAECWFVAIV